MDVYRTSRRGQRWRANKKIPITKRSRGKKSSGGEWMWLLVGWNIMGLYCGKAYGVGRGKT
jgi:hypothetical protein